MNFPSGTFTDMSEHVSSTSQKRSYPPTMQRQETNSFAVFMRSFEWWSVVKEANFKNEELLIPLYHAL